MKILEVRDSFIKFESDEKQDLSSFLEVKDSENKYIAQVVKTSKNDDRYISYAKVLFLYDGTFNPLKGKTPRVDASIVNFPFEIIQESFKVEEPISLGTYLSSTKKINIDKNALNRSFLASIDTPAKISDFVTNVAKNFDKSKVLVIDMLGVMNSSIKYKASVDFKLPLNSDSLDFIYEDCLSDATSDSKSMIKDIFEDLSEYIKTVPFVPFKTLKTIVDDMVEKSHIFKLLVLKNKLAKFEKEGYFAIAQEEIDSLNRIINLKSSVLDLSVLNSQFQNRYLKLIYAELLKEKYDGQVFVIASNSIDKKNIKNILQNSLISSTFITHSRFKYLNDFKSLFTNYLLEQTFSNNEIFKAYSMYLNNLPKDMLLLVGDSTNFLPIMTNLEEIEESPFDEVIEIEAEDDIDDEAELGAILYEVETPLDSQTAAIEKKAEDLIEKISGDIEQPISEELFVDIEDEDEEINTNDNVDTDDVSVTEKLNQSFGNEADFHTEVDTMSIENLVDEAQENAEEVVLEAENIVETVVQIEEDETASEVIEEIEEDSIVDVHEDIVEQVEIQDNVVSEVEELNSYEEIEYPSELSEIEDYEIIEENVSESNDVEEQITETISDYIDTEVIPMEEVEEFESIVEPDDDDINSDDVIAIDITDPAEEALNKEIIEDVDKVFTTMKEDSLSDSDLDFIDELNEEMNEISEQDSIETALEEIVEDDDSALNTEFEELNEYPEEDLEEAFIEPIEEFESALEEDFVESKEVLETKPSVTPTVPVYEAEIPQEDLVMSDPIEQGDTVSHAKYGVGIVEKMIKYGTKTLYSINFDNVGRRLLDPTLTEIKKA